MFQPDNLLDWCFIALTTAVALAAALAFYPARRLGARSRTPAWLAASAVVALSPSLIPLTSTPLRFVASLIAVALLVKLYDLHMEPRLSLRLSLQSYVAYLANPLWLVLRKEPSRVPATRDLRLLAVTAPAFLVPMLLGVGLWWQDWSAVPFAVEHTLKVSAIVLSVVLLANASAAAYRILGGRALDPMSHPLAAPTPAEFWRRWNRPAQQFFNEYAFGPAGGFRRPVLATLVTFVVSGLVHEYVFGIASGRIQGWQMLYFALQGCAVAATMRFRPKGRMLPVWIAGTVAFNLSSSALFFQSVNAVLPFYSLGANCANCQHTEEA